MRHQEDSMINELFWEQVKRICRVTKTTQKELALTCNIPLSTFTGWMRKNYFPTVIDGYLIAAKLGVSVEYLVTGRESDTKKVVDNIRNLLHRAEEKLGRLPDN